MGVQHKIVKVGNALGVALPITFLRSMGWCRGDLVHIFVSNGNIIIKNDTERTARFTRAPRTRGEERLAFDGR